MIKRKTDRGLDWMLEEGTQLLSHLNAEQSDLLQQALDEISVSRKRKSWRCHGPTSTPTCSATTRCSKART